MKCAMSGCKGEAVASLQQRQLRRVGPCAVRAYCDKHAPNWATIALIANGGDRVETPTYIVRAV